MRVTVATNPTDARTGTVVIANATVRVNQSGAAAPPAPQPPLPAPTPGPAPVPTCTYGVAPEPTSVAAASDEVTIAVTALGACSWTASSNASWIRIAAGAAGSGSGLVQVSISANTGGPRSGTLRVASETITVQQAARARPASSRTTTMRAGAPDRIAIDVTATSGCAWTAATDAAWVTIAAGRSGSGNGVVRLEIPANNGPARTAVVMIAGKTFTLLQNGFCNPTIKPEYYNAGRGPDDITIRVSAGSGCAWTAASPVSWVRVAEGVAGAGRWDREAACLTEQRSAPCGHTDDCRAAVRVDPGGPAVMGGAGAAKRDCPGIREE